MAQTTPEKSAGNGGQSGKNANPRQNNGNDQNKNPAQKAAAQKMAGQNNDAASNAMNDPIAMIKADHRKVEKLFDQFEKAQNSGDQSQLAQEICKELMVHTLLEEEIFYAECRDKMDDQLLNEAQVEHDGIKPLIMEIMEGSPEDEFFAAKVKVLSEDVKHHVKEEEKADGILNKAKQAGIATPELAKEMAERKQELMQEAQSGHMRPPRPRTFRVATIQMRGMRHGMERGRHDEDDYYNRPMPPRDEEGRFISRSRRDDDERDYRRPRSRYLYEHEGDDRRRMPPRDEEGRFRSRASRYDEDDDDDDRRGQRGHGGWYGDPRGHAEAARRGWDEREERGETRARSRYDDEDDDDDDRRHRGHGGWYGDPRGHSEAARRGWEHEDDESRGGRGWRRR